MQLNVAIRHDEMAETLSNPPINRDSECVRSMVSRENCAWRLWVGGFGAYMVCRMLAMAEKMV